MTIDVRNFEIKGQHYNLENVAKVLKQGKWDLGVEVLRDKIGLTSSEAREVALKLKAYNDGVEYVPPQGVSFSEKLNDKNSLGQAFKGIGIVAGMVGIIVSIYLGVQVVTMFSGWYDTTGFGIIVALVGIVFSGILGLILYGMGEMILFLNEIHMDTKNK